MTTPETNNAKPIKRIVVRKNGSYRVEGGIPLAHKLQVVSEFGEPLAWQKIGETEQHDEDYSLCRCGQSSQFPFCDSTHREVGFDGTETADTGSTTERQFKLRGGTHIIVKKDVSLCNNVGFCGLRGKSLARLVLDSDSTEARSLAIAMVERCPTGSLSYQFEPDGQIIEQDLPQLISDTVETLSEGLINGPLWVTGSIPVERSDGLPLETRNQVALCNCGKSSNKPLCDGTHRHLKSRMIKPKDKN